MSHLTRRTFWRLSGGALAGCVVAGSRASAQNEDETETSRTREEWIKEYLNLPVKRGPKGPLDLRRFADPMYILLDVIEWEPNAGQEGYPKVRVPRGFVTDFASIPSIFWSRFRPDGKYAYAATIHDYLYWTQTTTREDADTIFKFLMEDFHVSPFTITVLHGAVVAAGGWAWSQNAQLKGKRERRVLKVLPGKPNITWAEWKIMPGVFGDQ